MWKIFAAAVVAGAFATPAAAGLVDLDGGSPAQLPSTAGVGAKFYDEQDVAGRPDPWGGETLVSVGNDSLLGAHATTVTFTYRGNESGYDNTLELDGTRLVTANHTPAGTSWTLTAEEFGRLAFFSDGGGDPIPFTSEQVAVTAMANVLEIGFNDSWSGDADYDDLRMEAVVTPVPAALPLMATGLAGMAWWRRRQRRAAA